MRVGAGSETGAGGRSPEHRAYYGQASVHGGTRKRQEWGPSCGVKWQFEFEQKKEMAAKPIAPFPGQKQGRGQSCARHENDKNELDNKIKQAGEGETRVSTAPGR